LCTERTDETRRSPLSPLPQPPPSAASHGACWPLLLHRMAEQREQRLLRSVLDRLEDGNIGGAQVLLRRRLDCLAQQAKQVAAREEEARRRARTACASRVARAPITACYHRGRCGIFCNPFECPRARTTTAHLPWRTQRRIVRHTIHHEPRSLASQRPMMHPCRRRPNQCTCKRR